MILEKDFKERDTEIDGIVDDRIEMGVDTESINHLMMILSSNLYQNPIGSIVREYTSNAIDANVEAGIEEPVIVRLKKSNNNWYFEVQDFGTGLDDNDFRNIISKYGKSTKRDKVDQLGYFGLGCKSGFSYADSFYYTCRKDGTERKYLLYKSDTGFTIDLMFEKETSEPNGVAVTIPVSENDYDNFRKEIRNQLAYFDNVYFDVELRKTGYGYYNYNDQTADLNKDFVIHREKDFQYSSLSQLTVMHMTLGRVNYPIDWAAIGVTPINLPLALRFNLDCGIFPIPNRENLIWNKRTKEIVLEKLQDVAKWFAEKYNSNVKEADTLFQAWEYIMQTDKNVALFGRNFMINDLVRHSSVIFSEVKIKGMVHLRPVMFRTQYDLLLYHIRLVAEKDWNARIKTKNVHHHINTITKGKTQCAIIDSSSVISGFYREYLKTLGIKYFYKRVNHTLDLEKALSLKNYDPKIWKDVIKEYEFFADQFIKEATVDLTDIQNTPEFEQFKKDHKAKAKGTTYNGLNKQKDELTVSYTENKRYGGKFFKKQTFTMDKLRKHNFLTVFVDDNVDATDISLIYKASRVKFARIGVQDLKKIEKEKLNNFMTQRQMEKTKLFTRTATAILAKRVIADYTKLLGNHMSIVNLSVTRLKDVYNKVNTYMIANASDERCSVDMENSIMEIAEQTGNWDNSIIFEIKRLRDSLEDFKFITLMVPPKTGEKHEYEKHITSVLLFKKLKYQEKLENLEIITKTT